MEGLEPAIFCSQTETAQRFLASAYDSVEAMFENLNALRQLRKRQGRNIQGRLPGNEEDLLRAAVLFSGAGMDSALKRLIDDSLPSLLEVSVEAHDKLESFLAARIKAESASTTLARYLLAPTPRHAVILDYVSALTGDSLQSVAQVDRVAGALGLNDRQLRQEIAGLKSLFVARNQISHELDLQRTQKQGDRTRMSRKLGATQVLAHSGLNVTQKIINGVATALADC